MRKSILFIILGFIVIVAGYVAYSYFKNIATPVQERDKDETSNQEQIVGEDRDEHRCIGSAGYSWCEVKQKCLRTWEEPCVSADNQDQIELIKSQIKKAIVEKHGPDANNLTITVATIEGEYAKGGASEKDMGGGMWFGAKVRDEWKLVWDGNGIITCSDLAPYPSFPATLIPECFDESTNRLKTR